MPTIISFQETRRLFGPLNRPDFKTNVHHHAILRKALELVPPEELQAVFRPPIRLRVAMGSAFTSYEMGKIKTNFVRNGRLVSQETAPPDLAARQALRAYRDAYDTYFMKQGNSYSVRNPQARFVLQAAEQTWHDWVVPYLAARGMPGRPAWALQPLPGLQRVRRTPAPALRADTPAVETPRRRCAQAALPTPPPTSPVRAPVATPCARAPIGSRLRPMELSDDDDKRARRLPKKRKFLGVIDISDSEEETALQPRKKQRFLGVVDLTI
ncbi:hypothetical protein C8R44DRAFT_724574 [Mycena epipterygia]|nr:hypothetical protein C8R44DRAFT_724574 [Mycena epipterygia]